MKRYVIFMNDPTTGDAVYGDIYTSKHRAEKWVKDNCKDLDLTGGITDNIPEGSISYIEYLITDVLKMNLELLVKKIKYIIKRISL